MNHTPRSASKNRVETTIVQSRKTYLEWIIAGEPYMDPYESQLGESYIDPNESYATLCIEESYRSHDCSE